MNFLHGEEIWIYYANDDRGGEVKEIDAESRGGLWLRWEEAVAQPAEARIHQERMATETRDSDVDSDR